MNFDSIAREGANPNDEIIDLERTQEGFRQFYDCIGHPNVFEVKSFVFENLLKGDM